MSITPCVPHAPCTDALTSLCHALLPQDANGAAEALSLDQLETLRAWHAFTPSHIHHPPASASGGNIHAAVAAKSLSMVPATLLANLVAACGRLASLRAQRSLPLDNSEVTSSTPVHADERRATTNFCAV